MEISKNLINKYNNLGVHYEIISNSCYKKLSEIQSPFDKSYFPYLVAALITFDMSRQMGSGLQAKYDPSIDGFASRLNKVLRDNEQDLMEISSCSIVNIDLVAERGRIRGIYNAFAIYGKLCDQGKSFHVGATKLMHFLFPELFPIIDSNAAATLREHFGVPFKNSSQPGYCDDLFIESMLRIQDFILKYDSEKFRMLEVGTPITRVFDKLAFSSGADL